MHKMEDVCFEETHTKPHIYKQEKEHENYHRTV